MILNSKWILYKTGEYKSLDDKYGNPSPYFRRTFSLKGKVKKATLSVSAFGVFKIYLNGNPVSDDYLSPGWVDYSKKMPLIRYDITDKICENNAVGVVLGDGWAIGHVGSNYTFKRNSYNDHIEFTSVIKIEYDNGTVDEICTDNTWRASSGKILRSDIYMGEYVDNRLNVGDFSKADYDDSGWDFAEEKVFKFSRNAYLEEMKIPPIVVKHTFRPVLVSKNGNTYLYDVSQNISGVLNLVFKGERGTKVVIRHGELLYNDSLYTENLRKAEATDTYILSGEGEERFRPLFTFHGFRYAEITVYGEAEIISIIAEAMYTDLKSTGDFSCSDAIVSKIYTNALWSQRDNFLNVPTDCPQRDERLGWTADAQIFCQSAMYNMDCKLFYEKYLGDVRDAQLGNGVIPVVAPLPHIGFESYTGHSPAAGWSEAIAEIPYCHYKMYGDKRIIRDNLPALKKLIDYYENSCPEYVRMSKWTYGDWLSLGTPTNYSVISTLYYARAVYIASQLCRIIGDYEQERYCDLYKKITNAFRKRFMNQEGRIESDTQTCYAVAYKFGIIDKNEAKRNLVRKFAEDDGKITTGFLGVRFLLPTLCDIGRSDIAYRLITSIDYPGWGYSVVNGATTIWEHWDSYTNENGIKKGMNSFNHYSFGSCTEWMYEYCMGIRSDIENPCFSKVKFSPYFDLTGKINSVKGHYDTAYGRISVEWQRTGDYYEYRVSAPFDVKCEFVFEGMNVTDSKITNGEYCFQLTVSK